MSLLSIVIAGAFAVFGYVNARYFVRTKLRYVDAVQRVTAPLIAGGIAGLLIWVFPFVGFATALLFGTSVGIGVAAGARDVRRTNAGLLEP